MGSKILPGNTLYSNKTSFCKKIDLYSDWHNKCIQKTNWKWSVYMNWTNIYIYYTILFMQRAIRIVLAPRSDSHHKLSSRNSTSISHLWLRGLSPDYRLLDICCWVVLLTKSIVFAFSSYTTLHWRFTLFGHVFAVISYIV